MALSSLKKDTYHELLTCSWSRFFVMLFSSFLALNILFSLVFMVFDGSFVTPAHLRDYPRFISGIFLSVQTMSTIGYGGMMPTSLAGELVAAFESLIGLMFTALSTGMIFARLSQPSAKILFAAPFLYTESDEGPAFIFRVANGRGNDIINAQATLHMINLDQRSSKLKMVSVTELKLRRKATPTFYLNWVIIHDLNEESPLKHYTLEELRAPTMVYMLTLTGHDSSFNQTVFQYKRYSGEALRYGRYFKDMVYVDEETGQGKIDLELLDKLEEE